MKTLIKLNSNVSVYIFDDSTFISQDSTSTVVGNPVEFYILDCGLNNSKILENVNPPLDWVGHKYIFDGTTWIENTEPVFPI